MAYTDIGDNELVYLIRNGNNCAKDYLIERYKIRIYGMIKSLHRKFSLSRIDYEDYYHNCFVVFLKCLNFFDDNYCFFDYVKSAIEKELYKLINKEKRYEDIYSLDDDYFKDKYEYESVNDSSFLYEENEINRILNERFDEIDRQIINYKMKGYNWSQISKILAISRKAFYNRVDKIKNKLKVFL